MPRFAVLTKEEINTLEARQAPRPRPLGSYRMRQFRTARRVGSYWTRERVLTGLRRFYRERGVAPTSSAAWREAVSAEAGLLMTERRYPSFYAVLKHFRTFRQAWTAAGVAVDRAHEEFTPEEHWYIREAAGVITRAEIARDLGRTPLAVKTYLRDYGLHSYLIHGWAFWRIERLTGVSYCKLLRYVRKGLLPARRGSKCWQVDPADLFVVKEIDWTNPPPELAAAARHSLMRRLAGLLKARAQGTPNERRG